ncbi:hypothetical protein BKA57DRAFT_497274, partial [Linnemannia elongata]
PLLPPLAPLASFFFHLFPPSSYFSPSHPHSTLSSRPHRSSIPPSPTPPPPSTWPHLPVLLSTSVKECAQYNYRQGQGRPIQLRVSVSIGIASHTTVEHKRLLDISNWTLPLSKDNGETHLAP